MKLAFSCPICEMPARLQVKEAQQWTCPACDHVLEVRPPVGEQPPEQCALCGQPELYRKKNFPHWLGMSLLVVACLVFLLANAFYWKWLAWTVLIGSAVIDSVLYLTVGDAVVCYRCGAQHTNIPTHPERHRPFDLGIAERYRQERLRVALLRSENGADRR